jgi:hypothetical protein
VHPVTRRLARGALVVATALAATVASGTAPAGAQDHGPGTRGPIDHSGSATGNGYTAAAALLNADGGGTREGAMSTECEVPTRPGEPAHYGRKYYGANAEGAIFMIFYCEIDEPHPNEDATAFITYFAGYVMPLDPQQLVENALADLNLSPPVIHTDPGDGQNSLTGLATYLWIDEDSLDAQHVFDNAGPLRVEITARPTADGTIVWNTGEATVTCADYGQPKGSCSYTYQRSSVLQPGNQYRVTASVAFTGSYVVTLDGDFIGGGADIGDVVVPTAPYLLGVAEAQAINTNPRRPPA